MADLIRQGPSGVTRTYTPPAPVETTTSAPAPQPAAATPTTPSTPPPPAPSTTPPTGTSGTGSTGTPSLQQQQAFYAELMAAFPWLQELGLSPSWVQEMIAGVTNADELVAQIRRQPQYARRFPGLYRSDGSIRMTEAEYIRTEDTYRQLLRQYGHETDRDPMALVGFFNGDVDPNELRDRLEVYKGLEEGGQALKDVFYVYSGLNITTEDLYNAIVDPAFGQQVVEEFNERVIQSPLDYATYITRATEAGLSAVATRLAELQQAGTTSAEAVRAIRSVSPEFARDIMDQLHGGPNAIFDTEVGSPLSLQELISSFEFAAIGAAARNSGLELPARERLAEIRAAGVDRARMIQGYADFGRNQAAFSAAVQRARGQAFGVANFEAAAFLSDAAQANLLASGMASAEAAGQTQGKFRYDQTPGGRIVQRGFSRPW